MANRLYTEQDEYRLAEARTEVQRLRERIQRAVKHLDGLGTLTDTEREVLAILDPERGE